MPRYSSVLNRYFSIWCVESMDKNERKLHAVKMIVLIIQAENRLFSFGCKLLRINTKLRMKNIHFVKMIVTDKQMSPCMESDNTFL